MTLELAEKVDEMNRVVELVSKGYNTTQIAKETGIKRVQVVKYIEEWHNWVAKDQDVIRRAKETLALVDQHYALIIKQLWDTVKQADDADELRVKSSTLKILAGVEKDRAQLFQTAGMNDQDGLAMEIEAAREKQEILASILREVSSKCPHCQLEIKRRLSKYSGEPEVIEVIPHEE